jgi:radical SAM superfamily enzyme YgiQ (UPF0313 family)
VLCLYPYREDLKHGRYYPPLGLEIIARVLAPHCDGIDVVDLRHETKVGLDFVYPNTDMICLSVNWDRDGDFVREQIRSIPREKLTVVGGRHATEAPEKWLEDCPNIDILVRGDGEETIAEIARGEALENIAGISYRRDGRIVHNPNRKYGPIRDDIFPDRQLRRYRYTVDFEGADSGVAIDSLAGSRGCPFNCKFCSFNLNPWGEKRPYSARSPESVVEELAGMKANLVLFTDDVFTHDLERAEAICDLIIQRGIKKRFVVNSRIEIARRMDVVRKMEQAGFVAMLLGIESAQDKTLRAMNKGFNTAKIAEHFAKLRHTRMILHGYFILGCLGETEEEMLQIAPFARRLGVDTLGLSPLRTMPHDGLRQLVAESPGHHVSSEGFVYSDHTSRARLRDIRRIIWHRFYTPGHMLRLSWKLLRGGTFTLGIFARVLLAGARGEMHRRKHKRERRRRREEVRLKPPHEPVTPLPDTVAPPAEPESRD